MENPAKKRRQIVVLIQSPKKSKILVRKEHGQTFWNIPDSYLHWQIGKIKSVPSKMAAEMIEEVTSGLVEIDSDSLKRTILPSKAFAYQISPEKIKEILPIAEKVKNFYNLKRFQCEMHSTDEIKLPGSHSKYGSSTIEAVRSIFLV